MKKRILVVIITVLLAVVIAIGCLYAVDMYRMKNDEPVVFSTWGYDYAPQENLPEPPVLNLTDSSDNVLAVCLTSTHSWRFGNGAVSSDYPHPAIREYSENNTLRVARGTEIFIDNSSLNITDVNLYGFSGSDKLKCGVEHTENSIYIDMPDGEEYILEIVTEHKQGQVLYCVKVVEM